MKEILFGLFGLAVLIGIAWAFSNNKKRVDWRLVATGLALQLAFAFLVLKTTAGAALFSWISSGFVMLLEFTRIGSGMIFNDMADPAKVGFIFAFHVLPTIIFFAAFMSVLYHLGVMQWVVKGMAWVITRVMKVSGAETLSVCANAFIGQTEAPLVVKPYISKMTQSELLTLMVGGMATIAGGVMAAYVSMLGGNDVESQKEFAKHLLSASIMAAPATLVIAKILYPETDRPQTMGIVEVPVEKTAANVIDAAAAGASDGLKLALNVAAMLLAFTALIAVLNAPLQWLGAYEFGAGSINGWLSNTFGMPLTLSLQTLLGIVLAPIAWVIGIEGKDILTAGSLIGQKIVLNEFVAYSQLGALQVGDAVGMISAETKRILAYALCGFANFASIAIQIGGIGGLAPERRADLARFGLKAVLGGSLATLMTATIAGVLMGM